MTRCSKASAASGPCRESGRGVLTSVPVKKQKENGGDMVGTEAGQNVSRTCLSARPLRAGRRCTSGPSLPAIPDGCPEPRRRPAAVSGRPTDAAGSRGDRPSPFFGLRGGGSAAPGSFDFNENSARAPPSAAAAGAALPEEGPGHGPVAAVT